MVSNLLRKRSLIVAGAAVLIGIFALQLFLSVRQESLSWDEQDHIFAGYMTWKRGDYGLNPEHPPLVKMVAALPILNMQLYVPPLQNRYFKTEAFLSGKDFIFKNDADEVVGRARAATAVFALCLLVLVFLAAKEMFGPEAAFIALALLAFDPNLLAHGAMVATDTAVSCAFFATIYAFYRYVKSPSWRSLLVAGIVAGLALSTKHSTILLLPMVLILAVIEIIRQRRNRPQEKLEDPATPDAAHLTPLRLGSAIVGMIAIAIVVLWAFYGFRYAARPAGLPLNPPLANFIPQLSRAHEVSFMSFLSRWHLLPESYLCGLTDVRIMSDFYKTFVLGKAYPHGVWFYFPLVILIKTTVGLLGLTLLAKFAIFSGKLRLSREVLFVTIPPVVYLLVAMGTGMNIGVRHILPIYVFLAVLVGAAAAALIRHRRQWAYLVAALILLHIGSSICTYPTYIPYANELWGGPPQTHKLLTDSNADWGQQLKATSKYLKDNGIKECWFVYFAEGVIDTSYYGIPCKPLPTVNTFWVDEQMDVPASIDGTVLISAGNLSGFEFGPGPKLNPYEQFKSLKPKAVIQHSVFVYDGHFDIPLAAALVRSQIAGNLLNAGDLEAALAEAQQAVELAPDSVEVRARLGHVLSVMNRHDEARVHLQRALELAKTVEPEFQGGWAPTLEAKIKELPQVALR